MRPKSPKSPKWEDPPGTSLGTSKVLGLLLPRENNVYQFYRKHSENNTNSTRLTSSYILLPCTQRSFSEHPNKTRFIITQFNVLTNIHIHHSIVTLSVTTVRSCPFNTISSVNAATPHPRFSASSHTCLHVAMLVTTRSQ